jgi:NAD(P)-dependent dehydrogenase (short-subunit alcohol dehydrogenase family)
MASLEGRVALVTGGGRGVGRAISLALAEDGADIAVNYRRDEDAARDTVEAIRKLGRRAEMYSASIDSLEDDERLVGAALGDFGHVDILVNNAGIASRGQTVAGTDPDEVQRLLAAHAIGPHHLCRLLLPQMKDLDRGDIIFISSVATDTYAANGAPYNMGKAAMEALAFSLAKEVAKRGIRVNVVAPGLVETEMGRRLVKAVGVEDIHALDASMPLGRVCTPEDVANVVRFLVGDGGSYVTGARIKVNGGGQL